MYLCTRKTKDALLEDPLAQLVEHNTFNVGVLGSSPKRITLEDARNGVLFCYVSASYADIGRFAHFHTPQILLLIFTENYHYCATCATM